MKNLWIEVKKDDLVHNLENIKEIVGDRSIIAVVKNNAYGHGSIGTSEYLQDNVDYFAVSHLEEGVKLRRNGITKSILVMSPFLGDKEIVDFKLTPTISSMNEIDRLNELANRNNKIIKFHLKVNTGMNRFGFNENEISDLLKKLKLAKFIEIEGVYSHFSSNLDSNAEYTRKQLTCFNKMISQIKTDIENIKYIHIANSKAVTSGYKESFHNTVRIGNALYGKVTHSSLMFKKPYQAKAKIISTRTINKGDFLGYNLNFRAKKDMRVGILPVGTYDGLLTQRRSLNPKIFDLIKIYIKKVIKKEESIVSYKGSELKIIGDPCTQFVIIDITSNKELHVGSIVDVHIPIFSAKDFIPRIYI